jgi:hypothetical protein
MLSRCVTLSYAMFLCAFTSAVMAQSAQDIRVDLEGQDALLQNVLTRAPANTLIEVCSSIAQKDRTLARQSCGDDLSDAEVVRAQMLRTLTNHQTTTAQEQLQSEELRKRSLAAVGDQELMHLLTTYYQAVESQKAICSGTHPQIHNIGNQAVLTFETANTPRPANAGQRAVRIPVDGYGLDPRCVTFGVQIEGTVPVSQYGAYESEKGKIADFYVTMPSPEHPDVANIILLQPYIDRVKSGDVVSISVNVSERYPDGNGRRKVAYAKRSFTLYEVDQFRDQFLKDRIPPGDFTAFPLSETELTALYGPLIADNFFAVRVSLRNRENKAKLVTTGLIVATGTARVEPNPKDEPAYAVPVTVVPQSLQQVYAILQGEEVNQPRSIFFRALEFGGALASAINAATSAAVQATKNIGIFTGVVIPESKKVWPDRWPGYQKNLVDTAMPDLVKVGANAEAPDKVLFFSKRQLDGVVSDPYMYGKASHEGGIKEQQPRTYVISLVLDNLFVRYEPVFELEAVPTRDQAVALTTQIPDLLSQLDAQKPWLTNAAQVKLFNTPSTVWDAVDGALTNASAAASKLTLSTPTNKQLEDDVLNPTRKLLDGLKPGSDKSSMAVDLFGANAGIQTQLSNAQSQVAYVNSRIVAGVDASLLKDRIDKAATAVEAAKSTIDYYKGAAATLASAAQPTTDIRDALNAITKKPDDSAAITKLKAAYDGVKALLQSLQSKPRPATVTLNLAGTAP